MDVIKKAKGVEEYIIKCRRDLHQIPELGLNLPKTSAYVASEIRSMGIEFRENVAGSGVVGLIKGSKDGKTIALRADMDALPIKEETGLSFASQNDNMHACGHDAHTAILLGVAKVLSENKDEIYGNVKLIFQPAEESPGGAKPMLEAGAFENPKVDAVLGLHVGNLINTVTKNGSIGVCYGNMMACLDSFKVKLMGKGCHGAYPQSGVDPVVIMSHYLTVIQTIISRELAGTDSAVITVGKVNGGQAYNIIPNSVELEGTVRAVDQNIREYIARRLEEIAKDLSKTMRGTCEFSYNFGYPPLVNDEEFTKYFVESAKKIVPREDIIELKKPSMGGEDFSYYLKQVPGTFIFMDTPMAIDGHVYPNHNPKFAIDESQLFKGAALLIQGALDYLE